MNANTPRKGWTTDWKAMQNTPERERDSIQTVGNEFGEPDAHDRSFRRGRAFFAEGHTRREAEKVQGRTKPSYRYWFLRGFDRQRSLKQAK